MEQSKYLRNQLHFNLNSTFDRRRPTFKPAKPGPIIIEQIRETSTHQSDDSPQSTRPISKRLQQAIILARRDVRRGVLVAPPSISDHSLPIQSHQQQSPPPPSPPRSSVLLRPARRQPRFPLETPVSGSTVTRRQCAAKDKETLTRDEKEVIEIYRLRRQLNDQLKKIKKTPGSGGVLMPSPPTRHRFRETLFDQHQNAASVRAVVKAEEQAARSARMLYVLQRQVHDIQDELGRRERQPLSVRHTKKSQTLSRLAAAHRAAVRAIQTFVQCGQPRGYASLGGIQKELGYLIQQLSGCCTQMDIDGPKVMADVLESVEDDIVARRDKDGVGLVSGKQKKSKIVLKRRSTKRSQPLEGERRKQILHQRDAVVSRPVGKSTHPFPSRNLTEKKAEPPAKTKKKKKKRTTARKETLVEKRKDEEIAEKENQLKSLRASFQEMMGKEAARQVWLDQETQKQMEEIAALRRVEQERLAAIQSHSTQRTKSRRKPEEGKMSSLRYQLSEKAVAATSSHADFVAERLLNDLLIETAQELSRIDAETKSEEQAVEELSRPTLEAIGQHLDAFEAEEEEIRRKWRTIEYEDADDVESSGFACRFTSSSRRQKKAKASTRRETELCVLEETRDRLLKSQRAYDEYLRDGAARPLGRFDPSAVVEKISDGLLTGCLRDVADEIERHCDDYVEENVFSPEFAPEEK